MFLVSSLINASIFHITWMDTFWTDIVYTCSCNFVIEYTILNFVIDDLQERRQAEMYMFCEARRPNKELYYFTGESKGCVHHEEGKWWMGNQHRLQVLWWLCRPELTLEKLVICNFQKPCDHNYCEGQIGWKGNHQSGLTLRELWRWLKNMIHVKSSPGWCGSVDWVPACESKVWFPVRAHAWVVGLGPPPGGVWEVTDRCFSPFLPPFSPL